MAYRPPHLRNKPQPIVRSAATVLEAVNGPTAHATGASRSNGHGSGDTPVRYRTPPIQSSSDMKPARRLADVKLDPMELIQSVSRSGGDGAEGDALKDYNMQVKYRKYIDERIDKHYSTFRTPRHTAPKSDQKEELESLSSIVLLFRKLREGVVASGRIDDFAIEVFESSVRLAILAKHTSQLMSSLSGLVPGLYHAVDDTKAETKGKGRATALDDLVFTMETLSIECDNRVQFASILLLLQLVQTQTASNFHSTLLQLTSPPSTSLHPKLSDPPSRMTRRTRPLVPASSLSYAISASRALSLEQFDPTRYFQLLDQASVSLYERIVLSWAEERVRDRAWEVMKKAYMSMGLEWASRWIGEEGSEWISKRGARCEGGLVKLR